MRFITYVKQHYLSDEGYKGLFARTIKAQGKDFPVRTSYRTYWKFLKDEWNAPYVVMKAFDECFEEWRAYERKRTGN